MSSSPPSARPRMAAVLPCALLFATFPGCPQGPSTGNQGAVPLKPTTDLTADSFWVTPPDLMRPGEAVPLLLHATPSTTRFEVETVPPGLASLNAQGELVGGPHPGAGYLVVTDATGRRTLPVPVGVADRVVVPSSLGTTAKVTVSPDGTWAVVTVGHTAYVVDITSAAAEASGLAQPVALPSCPSVPCAMAADGSFCWIHEVRCTDPSLPPEFYELIGPPPTATLTQLPVPASVRLACDQTACDRAEDLAPDRQHAIVNRDGALMEVDMAAGTRTALGPEQNGRYGPHGKNILLTSFAPVPGAIRLADGTVTPLPDLDPRIPATLPDWNQPGAGYMDVDVTPDRFVVGYRTEIVFIHIDATGTVTGVSVRHDDQWGVAAGDGLRFVPGGVLLDADGIEVGGGQLP